MRDRVLLAEIALLHALDLLTTYYNLSTGLYYEANPFQRELMRYPLLYLVVHALGAAALYLIGLVMEKALGRHGRLVARLYYAALLSLPVLNNLGLVDTTLLYRL
jgi:hypothetical protein